MSITMRRGSEGGGCRVPSTVPGMSREQHDVVYHGPPMLGAVLIQVLEEEGLEVAWEGTDARDDDDEPAAEQEEIRVRLTVTGGRSLLESAVESFGHDHPDTRVELSGGDPAG